MQEAFSVEVERFVANARRFVQWCETSHSGEDVQAVTAETLRILADLYGTAQYLPDAELEDGPDPPDERSITQDELRENLSVLPFDIYWRALEPSNLEKDWNIACGEIFDDLDDIHADISDGLWLYDQGYQRNAVWHWKLTYFHWGNHLIGAMYALHLYQ